jgi:hypothetical protein
MSKMFKAQGDLSRIERLPSRNCRDKPTSASSFQQYQNMVDVCWCRRIARGELRSREQSEHGNKEEQRNRERKVCPQRTQEQAEAD